MAFKAGDIIKTAGGFVLLAAPGSKAYYAWPMHDPAPESTVILEPGDLVNETDLEIPLGVDLTDQLKVPEGNFQTVVARVQETCLEKLWRNDFYQRAGQFYKLFHKPSAFEPGNTWVSCSGKVYDEQEMLHLIDAALDFWLTAGRYATSFEEKLADFLGVRHCLLTNSGSSANLLAISALTSPVLAERRLQPGDEVITVAAGFPTTVAPIIQNKLVPVFVDVDLKTINVNTELLEAAVSKKTGAIILAHTLGNPFNLDAVTQIARKYKLWLIEDNCDALGSTYRGKYTGSFGDLATVSFYPAHQLTMGEGGAVLTSNLQLKKVVESLRNWGRDCWCPPGKDNTCRRRFHWKLGSLPDGYDHKYTYSHLGYNLKVTDLQAAIGVAQLAKLPQFITTRQRNFHLLYEGLKDFRHLFVLPEATEHARPCWFGFYLTLRENAPFSRQQLIHHLENHLIRTRLLFAGNVIRQPAFKGIPHRVAGGLHNTDTVMNRTFWIGLYPGLGEKEIYYVIRTFADFIQGGREHD